MVDEDVAQADVHTRLADDALHAIGDVVRPASNGVHVQAALVPVAHGIWTAAPCAELPNGRATYHQSDAPCHPRSPATALAMPAPGRVGVPREGE